MYIDKLVIKGDVREVGAGEIDDTDLAHAEVGAHPIDCALGSLQNRLDLIEIRAIKGPESRVVHRHIKFHIF